MAPSQAGPLIGHSAGERHSGRSSSQRSPHGPDLDLLEINEAFAGVALASVAQLGVGLDRVNVNGGALVLGHAVAMSGARVILTLAHELRRRGGGSGVAALCGGVAKETRC